MIPEPGWFSGASEASLMNMQHVSSSRQRARCECPYFFRGYRRLFIILIAALILCLIAVKFSAEGHSKALIQRIGTRLQRFRHELGKSQTMDDSKKPKNGYSHHNNEQDTTISQLSSTSTRHSSKKPPQSSTKQTLSSQSQGNATTDHDKNVTLSSRHSRNEKRNFNSTSQSTTRETTNKVMNNDTQTQTTIYHQILCYNNFRAIFLCGLESLTNAVSAENGTLWLWVRDDLQQERLSKRVSKLVFFFFVCMCVNV